MEENPETLSQQQTFESNQEFKDVSSITITIKMHDAVINSIMKNKSETTFGHQGILKIRRSPPVGPI